MAVSIRAQQMRQHQRIPPIRFAARNRIPIPITIRDLRVDLIHPMPRRPHRTDQQPATSLNRHIHRNRLPGIGLGMLCQQRQQRRQPGRVFLNTPAGQHRASVINDRHLMMLGSPINPAINRHRTSPPIAIPEPRHQPAEPRDALTTALTARHLLSHSRACQPVRVTHLRKRSTSPGDHCCDHPTGGHHHPVHHASPVHAGH